MSRFEGTFQGRTTGGGGGIKALLAVVAVLIVGGGGLSALAGIAGALAGLLYCVAAVTGVTVAGAPVVWFATRNVRAAGRARVTEALARGQQAREAEIEERHARRAAIQAHAQAQAWMPMIGTLVAALQPAPAPQPIFVQSEQQEIQP